MPIYAWLSFSTGLIQAAERGVHVRLLLQGRTDHPIVRNATALLYNELINAGVEIIECHQKMLHAKVAVIDRFWCTVGSCNLDFFSLFLGLEANVIVEDAKIANELRERLERAIEEGGVKINTPYALKRSPWDWFISWTCLFILRFIQFLSRSDDFRFSSSHDQMIIGFFP